MVRPPSFDINGMKKGAWSEEEDNKLRAFVLRYGHWNWRLLPKCAGLARCGKSCRLRWVNYLKPGVRRGNFSKEEEDLIIKLHAQLGNKWSAIATKLPGRTDNEIKNHWHAHINKRRRRQNPAAKKVVRHTNEASSNDQVLEEEKASAFTLCKITQNESASLDATSHIKLQQSTLSFDTNHLVFPATQPEVDIWPDIYISQADTICNQNYCFPPLLEEAFYYPEFRCSGLSSSDSSYLSPLHWIADDDDCIISSEYIAQPVQGSFWSEFFASNCQNGSNCIPPPHEVGGLCDPFFQYFDDGMNFF